MSSNMNLSDMTDDELEETNQRLMSEKERIRNAQLAINREQTERYARGVKKIAVGTKGTFGREKRHVVEVPYTSGKVDTVTLKEIESQEDVPSL